LPMGAGHYERAPPMVTAGSVRCSSMLFLRVVNS